MRDTGLAARIRAKGVKVQEVAGWTTRGNDGGSNPTFRPIGALNHHTAGSASGATPSLSTCIYGRPDVPGPLCQVLQSREPDPWDDTAYVIASGKANHGGEGTWSGPAGTMNSNYESEGLEVEHVGTGRVNSVRLEIAARIIAAMLEAPGSSRSAAMACQHFEYAPDRKIDFFDLHPYNADTFRARVGYWIGRTINDNPPEEDDSDMTIQHFYADGVPMRTVVDGHVTGWRSNAARQAFVAAQTKAGIKQATTKFPTKDDFNTFSAQFTESSELRAINEALDEMLEEWLPALTRIEMYEAAQLQIETREEARDTAQT